MRALSLGMGLLSLSGVMLSALLTTVAGCSASGSDNETTDPSAVNPAPTGTMAHEDPKPIDDGQGSSSSSASSSGHSSSSSSSGGTSSGSHDAGKDAKADARMDAAPPHIPMTGEMCSTVGELYQKTCGFCGHQEALCEDTDTIGDYGFCQDEVAHGCEPGKIEDVSCGRCGTMKQVCQADCTPAVGSCTEPSGACWPGQVQYTTAGCMTPKTYRKQTCGMGCTYGAPSALPCGPKDTFASIPGPGGEIPVDGTMSATTDTIGRLDAVACPATVSTTKTSYAYNEVRNPFTKAATIEVRYDSAVGSIDTVTAAYVGAKAPDNTNATERKACVGRVNDICSDGTVSSWSCLVGTDAVKIPAGGSAWIYTANYYSTGTGPYRLLIKTISLDP